MNKDTTVFQSDTANICAKIKNLKKGIDKGLDICYLVFNNAILPRKDVEGNKDMVLGFREPPVGERRHQRLCA